MRKVLLIIATFLYPSFTGLSQQSTIDSLINSYMYDKAKELLETTLLSNNKSSDLYYKLGVVNSEMESHDDAILAYEKYLQYHPNDIRCLVKLADSQISLGLYNYAENIYSSILNTNSGNSFVRKKLAEVKKKKSEYWDAFCEYLVLFQNDTTNSYYAKQLGYCASKSDSIFLAMEYYSKSISINPFDELTRINYCKLLVNMNFNAPALMVIDDGLLINSSSIQLIEFKADLLYRQKNYQKAIEYFEIVKHENEQSFNFLKKFGFSLYYEERNEEAIAILSRADSLKQGNSALLYIMGVTERKIGHFKRSEELLQMALEASHPDQISDYYKQIADVQGLQRKIEESILNYKKAYQINENNKTLLFHIATSLEEYDSDKTVALVYYNQFLAEKSNTEKEKYVLYALDRSRKIKEQLFFDVK